MPDLGLLLPTGLVGTTSYPYSITVDGQEVAVSNAQLESIEFEENASDEPGYARMWIVDQTNSINIVQRDVVRVVDYVAQTTPQVFLGHVQVTYAEARAVGRRIYIQAISISDLLDHILVPSEARQAESDQARVLYLWGKYSRYPLVGDVSLVTQTNAAVSADLMAGMTLRAALNQTAGLAGSSTRWYIDSVGRLVWRSGGSVTSAPFNVNVTQSPGGGEIAPQNLKVTRDGEITNRVYVRGANAAGSGWFQDDASAAAYGPVEEFIDAPSADTAAKAQTIAQLQLGKVADANIRASFETDDPKSGWRADQNVTVTSAADNLSATSLRIAKVTTTFTRGDGKRHYVIEAGKTGASLSGKPTPQTFVPANVGQPAFLVRNRLTFVDNNGVELGAITASPTSGIAIIGNTGTVNSIGPRRELVRAAVNAPAATDTLTSECELLYLLPSGGPVTMTSTPTIEASNDDQILIVYNANSSTVTLQDRGTLANSGLFLTTTTIVLGQNDSITLIYSATAGGTGGWVEVSRSNVL